MNTCNTPPKFLTVPEVAETFRVSLRTVFRWMSDGLLPVVRIGKVTRIQQADLDAFLQAHRSPTSTSQEVSL